MEWTKLALAVCAIIGAILAIARWLGNSIETRIMANLNNPKDGALTLIREEIDGMKLEAMRTNTWLDINKAMLATHGGATHASDFAIDTAWMREKIVSSGYKPDPVMLAEFRRLCLDPETPADDVRLWNVIELRFGTQELAQEVMRFGAAGETAPAIWILCIRKAQQIGVDELLQEIGIEPEPVLEDDGA